MERKAFVISRATWWRGQTAMGSMLLRAKDGMMCCLGNIALQAGATQDQIRNIETPSALRRAGVVLDVFLPLLRLDPDEWCTHSELGNRMMAINDDSDITDAERETALTRLAAPIGWDLTFTD